MSAATYYAGKRAGKSPTRFISGFCNLNNDLASHGRCSEYPRSDGKVCCCERDGCPCAGRPTNESEPMTITDAPTSLIQTPGLVYDMDDETYHGDPVPGGSLSSTFARLLTNNVPAKADAIRRNRKPTKAMNLGKAAHAHTLGAGPQLIVWEHDGRTKEGKAERAAAAPLLATEAAVAVTERERDQVMGMVAALRAHPEVVAILGACRSEVSGFWSEGDVWMRARYDILTDRAPYDYKTCEDASRRGFSKAMASYGYHQQADFYGRGLRALGHAAGNAPMQFICQETTAPYLVQVHTPDSEAMWAASELNDRAIRVYAEAKRTGIWPGYPELFAEPTPLPPWYFNDHEDVLEMDLVI